MSLREAAQSILQRSALLCTLAFLAPRLGAQETDVTQTPNRANAGIQKSLVEEIGAGRGDVFTASAQPAAICASLFASRPR